MAKIVDVASNIWKFELDESDETSIAAIAQKLRVSIGLLNNYLSANFYVNETTFEIADSDTGTEITEEQIAIFTNIYLDYFYSKQAKQFLGAGGVDVVNLVQQDGHVFKGLDRNGIAKTYLELKKQNKEELKRLLNLYKFNRSRASQVTGDDHLSKNYPYTVDSLNNATISS